MKIHETEPDSEQRQSDRSPGRRFGIWVRRGDRSRANDVSWPMKTHHEKAAGFSPRSLISRERPADGGRSVTLRGEIQGAHTPRHLTQTLRMRASVARTGFCLPISGVPFEHLPGKSGPRPRHSRLLPDSTPVRRTRWRPGAYRAIADVATPRRPESCCRTRRFQFASPDSPLPRPGFSQDKQRQ